MTNPYLMVSKLSLFRLIAHVLVFSCYHILVDALACISILVVSRIRMILSVSVVSLVCTVLMCLSGECIIYYYYCL